MAEEHSVERLLITPFDLLDAGFQRFPELEDHLYGVSEDNPRGTDYIAAYTKRMRTRSGVYYDLECVHKMSDRPGGYHTMTFQAVVENPSDGAGKRFRKRVSPEYNNRELRSIMGDVHKFARKTTLSKKTRR